jgi:hypothetical protein
VPKKYVICNPKEWDKIQRYNESYPSSQAEKEENLLKTEAT